jgi:hypothetical protein
VSTLLLAPFRIIWYLLCTSWFDPEGTDEDFEVEEDE